MCNPRRVTIPLNRRIAESWRTTVEQAARLEGQVEELARLTIDVPLAGEMGALALEILERLVRGDYPDWPAWKREANGDYRHDLGGVSLVYRSGTRQLLAEARLAETVSAEMRASAEASGFTVGEVAVEAAAQYYDDNWGGREHEECAEREARGAAERQLVDAVENLHRQQHQAELEAARQTAEARARELAATELERQRDDVRQALRQRLCQTLADERERIQHTVNRLVGETYRRTLLHVVQQNGGRVLSDQRSGSVIDLEVELF